MAALFAALFTAQVVAALGFGAYFPWSVPGLFAGTAGPGHDPPNVLSFLLVLSTGSVGVYATAAWWRKADHNR